MTDERIAAIRGLDWLTQPVFEPGAAIVRECLDEIERLKKFEKQWLVNCVNELTDRQAEHIRRLREALTLAHTFMVGECTGNCSIDRLLAETEPK